MDMLKQLNSAIRYLEENLRAELDLDEAAKLACLTKDSFRRFFSYMTGMTVTEYIRCRRLSLAARDLQETREKVIEIAGKYGYESVDAFSKAFVRQHGMPPTQARIALGSLKIYPPVSFHMMIKGAKEMNFRLVNIPETAIFGISRKYDVGEFPTREALRHTMWSEDWEDVPGKLANGRWNQPGSTAYDGIWYGLWKNGRYMIGRENLPESGLEPEMIPAGKYAAFSTDPGGLAWEELPRLFELIFDSWLPDSGYRLRNPDIVEVYHLWTDHEQRKQKRYYEVWIPVE